MTFEVNFGFFGGLKMTGGTGAINCAPTGQDGAGRGLIESRFDSLCAENYI